jgi:hypothetical protein
VRWVKGFAQLRRVKSSTDSASPLPYRVNRGGENPIADRLNRVNEDLKTDLEKSRFFNRTAPIHDPVIKELKKKNLSLSR